MWTIRRRDQLPGDPSPPQWLERVLPHPSEALGSRYHRCREALEDGSFDLDATLFASSAEDPAGLVVVTAAAQKARIEMVAVREDLRRRGLGRSLLKSALSALREKGIRVVCVQPVSSRDQSEVGLLTSLGFAGRSLGSLRMRRRLQGDLPVAAVAPGYELRALRAGEEEDWVWLKNACFPDDAAWELERFRRELSNAACFDFERILVATAADRLVGTTIAWEADYGDGPVGLIHWVGVHPEHRGIGLGKALNLHAMSQLADRGYHEAWLNTSRSREAAVGLYEGLGFEVYREYYTYELTLE